MSRQMGQSQSYRIPSARLRSLNYDEGGYYFVTACVQNWFCVFGTIEHSQMKLSALGKIVQSAWIDVPNHHDGVELDEFVVMPNHMHGILHLPHKDVRLNPPRQNLFASPASGTLGSIMRSFKSAVTKSSNENNYSFHWQPRFWDHVIRNNAALLSIREYIWQNPVNWAWDSRNPAVAHLYEHSW